MLVMSIVIWVNVIYTRYFSEHLGMKIEQTLPEEHSLKSLI